MSHILVNKMLGENVNLLCRNQSAVFLTSRYLHKTVTSDAPWHCHPDCHHSETPDSWWHCNMTMTNIYDSFSGTVITNLTSQYQVFINSKLSRMSAPMFGFIVSKINYDYIIIY